VVPLGDWQFLPRGTTKLPVPGGMGALGSFNVAGYSGGRDSSLYPTISQGKIVNGTTDLTQDGYVINYGSSFMMAVTFDDKGPVGKHILTYSQSSEPDSPHYTDETERYGKGQWLDILFHDAEIDASAGVTSETVATQP
jgi:acyl-homoserine-lactone acylase